MPTTSVPRCVTPEGTLPPPPLLPPRLERHDHYTHSSLPRLQIMYGSKGEIGFAEKTLYGKSERFDGIASASVSA